MDLKEKEGMSYATGATVVRPNHVPQFQTEAAERVSLSLTLIIYSTCHDGIVSVISVVR